jgi:hypothetical protein
VFRLICLNNVIKTYIYTKLFEPFPQVRRKASKTYPYNLRNDAHFQFYTEFRNLVQKEEAVKQKIASQFEEWLPLYDKEDAALKKIQKSAITAQIQKADRVRDEIYLGMVETNAVISKYALSGKPRSGRGGEQPEQQNGTAEAQ